MTHLRIQPSPLNAFYVQVAAPLRYPLDSSSLIAELATYLSAAWKGVRKLNLFVTFHLMISMLGLRREASTQTQRNHKTTFPLNGPLNDVEFVAEVGELGRFEDLYIINDDFKRTYKAGQYVFHHEFYHH